MSDKASTHGFITRRRFLQMGAGVPAFAVTVSFPFKILRAADEIGAMIEKVSVGDQQYLPPRKPYPEGETLSQDGIVAPGKKPKAPRLIMIDPGHGGKDPGAIGKSGVQEKDVTLDIAMRMMDILAPLQEVSAKLTRSSDEFIPLPERVKIAQEARADLFMSVHADSAPNRNARGLSAYTLSEKASDEFSKALAKQENRIEAMGGVDIDQTDKDVAKILMDLTARRTRNTSQRVRHEFVRRVGKTLLLLERPMRAANFAVLRAPDVPSMLVETGFLSNPRDEASLCQPDKRQRIADIMAREMVQILNSDLFG